MARSVLQGIWEGRKKMFALEKEMTSVVTNNCRIISGAIETQPEASSFALALELPVKYRLVDIAIAYALPDAILDSQTTSSFKYMSGLTMDIFAQFLLHRSVSHQRLKSELFMERDEIDCHLQKLERKGLIERISRFSYQATSWQELRDLRVISIELKLCNWREALEQAEYNLLFSDYSFVALDKDRVGVSEEIKSWFREKNIGLIFVDTDETMDIIFTPKKNHCLDKNLYITQRLKILRDLALRQKWVNLIEESY